MQTKLIESHDWLRVEVKDGKQSLSLTMGRSGETCSGSVDIVAMKRVLMAFSRFREKKDGMKIGEKMAKLEELGKTATSLDGYIDSIEVLVRD